ncbi:hypothetical protein JIQ42_02490 [Leishmania sp. Namibia]|uniref:hypothetical protein n=1 Tax=Leishmania sp. Namibia TaxID=2802991 RepID=UPI001B7A7861|nr:hypothetical protein JIQ42_02490 [Leishmania sp. Namibia]
MLAELALAQHQSPRLEMTHHSRFAVAATVKAESRTPAGSTTTAPEVFIGSIALQLDTAMTHTRSQRQRYSVLSSCTTCLDAQVEDLNAQSKEPTAQLDRGPTRHGREREHALASSASLSQGVSHAFGGQAQLLGVVLDGGLRKIPVCITKHRGTSAASAASVPTLRHAEGDMAKIPPGGVRLRRKGSCGDGPFGVSAVAVRAAKAARMWTPCGVAGRLSERVERGGARVEWRFLLPQLEMHLRC